MKRQPRVKVEQRQSDEKAAMVKAKPVLLEENPGWPVEAFSLFHDVWVEAFTFVYIFSGFWVGSTT